MSSRHSIILEAPEDVARNNLHQYMAYIWSPARAKASSVSMVTLLSIAAKLYVYRIHRWDPAYNTSTVYSQCGNLV